MSDAAAIARTSRVFEDTLNVTAPGPEVDIIDTGLIDSLALVTLIFELEREFDVRVPLESLDADDFRTIANMARMVTSLRPEASA